jgi:hypothetical protein
VKIKLYSDYRCGAFSSTVECYRIPMLVDYGISRLEKYGFLKGNAAATHCPSAACATVNPHDEIAYGRRGRVEGSWKVAARGKGR